MRAAKLTCSPVIRTGSNPQKSAVAVIPARFQSSRLPGKPLLDICGRPMIVRVCERAAAAKSVARVVVATDDARILDAVRAAGYEALMTSGDCASGGDRVAEAAAALGETFEIVVN